MSKAGTAYVDIDANTAPLKKQLDQTVKRVGDKVESDFKAKFGKAAAIAGAAFLAQKGLQLGSAAIGEAREAAQIQRQTEAVIKSTGGAANVTAAGFANYANELSRMSGVDDEMIQSGENVLATFTNIKNAAGAGNDVFNQTTAAALDMSAALGTDLQGNVMTLGKALNDPVKGVTRLTRAGVTFTDQQKKQIAALVKSGDTLGAQKVILKELSKEFGGSAKAAADPMKKMQVAGENLKEKIGTAILPAVNALADGFSKIAEFVTRNMDVIGPLVAVLATAAAVIYTVVTATKIWTAVQTAFNVIMSANPIVLIVLGIAALVVALVVAYQKVGWFHRFIDKVWQAIQVGWSALVTGLKWAWEHVGKPAFDLIAGAISLWWNYWIKPQFLAAKAIFETVWTVLKSAWEHVGKPVFSAIGDAVGVVGTTFGKMRDVVVSVWDGIYNTVKTIWNKIADLWNSGPGKVNISIYNPVGDDFKIDVPDLPKLHSGGEYRAPRAGGEGLALLRDREVVLTPEQVKAGVRTGNSNGGVTINNYHPVKADVALAAVRRQERLYA